MTSSPTTDGTLLTTLTDTGMRKLADLAEAGSQDSETLKTVLQQVAGDHEVIIGAFAQIAKCFQDGQPEQAAQIVAGLLNPVSRYNHQFQAMRKEVEAANQAQRLYLTGTWATKDSDELTADWGTADRKQTHALLDSWLSNIENVQASMQTLADRLNLIKEILPL